VVEAGAQREMMAMISAKRPRKPGESQMNLRLPPNRRCPIAMPELPPEAT
jgi:hypothetical protein